LQFGLDLLVLNGRLSQRLFEMTGSGAQPPDLVGGRLACGIDREPSFAGLEELLRPSLIVINH
jgi:hypothetical protein